MKLKGRILLSIVLSAVSCKYLPNKTRTKGEKLSGRNVIDTQDVSFERTSNNDAGNLSFKINPNYDCEVAYWSNNPNINPNSSSPVIYKCPLQIQDSISLLFENLSLVDTYNFEIIAWPRGLSRENSVRYIYKEKTDILENIKVKNIYLIHYNNQTKAMKINYLALDKENNLNIIQNELAEELLKTCSVPSLIDNLSLKYLNIPITNIATDGYLSSKTSGFFNKSSFIRLRDEDTRQDWTMSFIKSGVASSIYLPKPQFIKKVELIEDNKANVISNYDFKGNVGTKKVSSSNSTISYELEKTSKSDTIIGTNIDNDKKCTLNTKKVINVDFSKSKTNIAITSLSLDWIYSSRLGDPVLFLNTDQFFTIISK